VKPENLDAVLIGLRYNIDRVCSGIDDRSTDYSDLDKNVLRIDNSAWHGSTQRCLPVLCSGVRIESIDAVMCSRYVRYASLRRWIRQAGKAAVRR